MFSGFQSNAYQGNAYQIVRGAQASRGGGRVHDYTSYETNKKEWIRLENERQENARALKAKERQVERIENKRREDLANQELQVELLEALKALKILEDEKAEILRLLFLRRQDEDDVLILLLSLPFMN